MSKGEKKMIIEENMLVEDLVVKYPKVVSFLRQYNIVCIHCGEPVWGTIGELIEKKGLDKEQILLKLNEFVQKEYGE